MAVVVVELLLAALVWNHAKPQNVVVGFLVKNGSRYVIAWKDEYAGYNSRSYGTLKDALHFLNDDLKLSRGRNPIANDELEFVQLQDRFGAFVLIWKTINISILNRLTFQSEADARYFVSAFKQGGYTPSPFGHSVLFMPTKVN